MDSARVCGYQALVRIEVVPDDGLHLARHLPLLEAVLQAITIEFSRFKVVLVNNYWQPISGQ